MLHDPVRGFVYAVGSIPPPQAPFPSPKRALMICPVVGFVFQKVLSIKLSLFRVLVLIPFWMVVTDRDHEVLPMVRVPILVV